MPRGGHKVKAVKTSEPKAVVPFSMPGKSLLGSKSSHGQLRPNSSIHTPSNLSATDLSKSQSHLSELTSESSSTLSISTCSRSRNPSPSGLSTRSEGFQRPTSSRNSSSQSSGGEQTYQGMLNTLGELAITETQSSTSSTYSANSTSIYSSASSIRSSATSVYSFDASEDNDEHSSKGTSELHCQIRTSAVAVRRQDTQSRERSLLAKKAALFKNSRLRPHLPSFKTSLHDWSMICRAAQASLDCYDSESATRRGTYTPANTSKDIKAMIVDDQLIDDSRLIIVAIRGTQCQSLTDWTVNKAATPTRPTGFFDDEDNECHEGFLQVTKAMVSQVVAKLEQHAVASEKRSLIFTGHSAGGAVAAMLYTHMLSSSVTSDLIALADRFSSISCVTFGAPPLTRIPLSELKHGSGVFLAFVNEGDPIVRFSDAAYAKSMAKLLTASAPAKSGEPIIAPPPAFKVVRGSRGGTVYRQPVAQVSSIPREDLPLWPTPPGTLSNAGKIVLLRDQKSGSATASTVLSEDMDGVIFGDLAQHGTAPYMRRVQELALAAMLGRS